MSSLIAKLDIAHFPGYWVARYSGLRDQWMTTARLHARLHTDRALVNREVHIARMYNQELVRELRRIRADRVPRENPLLQRQAS
jgi:hypothetical protein